MHTRYLVWWTTASRLETGLQGELSLAAARLLMLMLTLTLLPLAAVVLLPQLVAQGVMDIGGYAVEVKPKVVKPKAAAAGGPARQQG